MTIDKQQARALFEIGTMGWHGNITFPEQLEIQMKAHFKTFHEESNPSKEENRAYQTIKTSLHGSYKQFLQQGFICPLSGHEIDIAYVEGSKKVAINVDGPCHFDLITHQSTMKTIFRDICLKRAGWSVINIDLVTEDYVQRCGEIAVSLNERHCQAALASHPTGDISARVQSAASDSVSSSASMATRVLSDRLIAANTMLQTQTTPSVSGNSLTFLYQPQIGEQKVTPTVGQLRLSACTMKK
jgi:very-short-patch-repair endonuclease